ncbi:MAG: O-methyltransferase [Desulfobacteraceae bacterium]|nr:O-methyltransferase [Desulfobacteraceae bacterium]
MNPMVENPLNYFRQWVPSRSTLLGELEAEAKTEQIPIIGPVVGQLLYLLARIRKPKLILELGTAIGYSTIYLAKACQSTNGRIISFEISPALIDRARVNLSKAGLDHLVEVRGENALEALARMQAPAEMIFMDIEKADYIRALPHCSRLLISGGLLVADNTGFKDAHPFNQSIYSSEDWEIVNLWSFLPEHSPEHDGLCIALRK